MRVARPNEDDWKKLKRVLQYLRGTIDLVLTLGADDIVDMQAWVDVTYAVHEDLYHGDGELYYPCERSKS